MSRHNRSRGPAARAQPAPPPRPPREAAPALTVIRPDAAGIDVHSDMHVVCVPAAGVPPATGAGGSPADVRRLGANSCDLHAIADWLRACGVTTVAMESTGVHWVPLFELPEARGFEVWRVEPGQLPRCGARPKTDALDAQWIQRLHSYGLLQPPFRPAGSVLALRGHHRRRQMLVRYAAGHTLRMQRALDQMDVKLAEVVSGITGLTGQRIIAAILGGERDPRALAALRGPKCKNDAAKIAQPPEGTWRPEHLFALRQAHEVYGFLHQQIAACGTAIRAELDRLPDRAGGKAVATKPRRCGRKPNDLSFDARAPLFRALGVDLAEVEGIDAGTALVILAEIGVDVSRFPTEKHFASWPGACPRQHQSNRAAKKRGPRRGKNRVAIALRMAARAVGRTQSPLGLFYRRVRGRIGGQGAVTATAHELARLVYRMLTYGAEYVRQSMAEYEVKSRAERERQLRAKAARMGFELVPRAAAVP